MNSTSRGSRLVSMRGQVAGPLEHRAGGRPQVDAQLGGDDVRQRGLAQARRAESSTWSSASPRWRAAVTKISSCAFTAACPMYSLRRAGRMARSTASSSLPAAPLMIRSGSNRGPCCYERLAPCRARRINSSVECVPGPIALSKRVASAGR